MFGAINRLIGRQARRPDAKLLALTLNNMTQGVVLFDISGRLVVCNEQYRAMYGLSPQVVRPGSALIDIIRNRISSGSKRTQRAPEVRIQTRVLTWRSTLTPRHWKPR